MKSPFNLVLLVALPLFAHSRSIDDILTQKEVQTMQYRIPSGYLEALVINMNFGSATIISIMDKAKMKDSKVFQVDLVFTDFPKGIDLMELNKERIKKALEANGTLVSDETISWRLIRQMGCKSEADAKIMFHGVIIHYRPPYGPEEALREDSYLSTTLPPNDSIPVKNEHFKRFSDSTVVAVMRRNKSWKNSTIVTDVTGSMSPYIAQVGLWYLYKLNKLETTNFVLFNDGNSKMDSEKITGKTGGIYISSAKEYNLFLKTLNAARSGGSGGDIQENGIEAILQAQKDFPKATEIIFIADNYAPLRDVSLTKEIKVPVRIVVCGTQFFVNLELLNLARDTGGSIHTIEKDLLDLAKLAEGKIFELNKKRYIIKSGKIELLKST
ncbi:MAG: hypothetical protein V4638_04390 [Bacteroidota bacterium]